MLDRAPPLDPESERRLARALDLVREKGHRRRQQRRGGRDTLVIEWDNRGRITARTEFRPVEHVE